MEMLAVGYVHCRIACCGTRIIDVSQSRLLVFKTQDVSVSAICVLVLIELFPRGVFARPLPIVVGQAKPKWDDLGR